MHVCAPTRRAGVPIMSSGEVLGIVTHRDIACRAVARGWNGAELPASAVMSSPLVAIRPDETFDGRLLGIVAQADLGRRMSNRELGQLARETAIRGVDRGPRSSCAPMPEPKEDVMRKLIAAGAIAAGAAAMTYAAYRKDIETARQRIGTERQVIESGHGPIEFGECGDGPAVLVIHGAGGGFDQGLVLGRGLLGDDYRVIAPSRFGYLGTPVPDDPSAEAQADAHLRLPDALQLEAVPVIAASAGAPSAMQLCLRHPERCSALVLVVPPAWTPDRTFAPRRASSPPY